LLTAHKNKRPLIEQITNSDLFNQLNKNQLTSPIEQFEVIVKMLAEKFGEKTIVSLVDSMRSGNSTGPEIEPWVLGFLLRKIRLALN
jgi:hypothetical protein